MNYKLVRQSWASVDRELISRLQPFDQQRKRKRKRNFRVKIATVDFILWLKVHVGKQQSQMDSLRLTWPSCGTQQCVGQELFMFWTYWAQLHLQMISRRDSSNANRFLSLKKCDEGLVRVNQHWNSPSTSNTFIQKQVIDALSVSEDANTKISAVLGFFCGQKSFFVRLARNWRS